MSHPSFSTAANQIADVERQGRRIVLGPHGARIVWRVFGSGPRLVLLHGGHGSWMHWLRNIPALSQSFELLVPDMPGFGDSDLPDTQPGLTELALRLATDLDQLLRGEGFAIAGFSFGGLVAATVAANTPERVHRLALVGSAGSGSPRREVDKLWQWRNLSDPDTILAVMRHNLRAHMLSSDAAIDALALEVYLRSCRATRYRSRPISRQGGLLRTLDRFGGPILLLWGRDDVTADPDWLLPRLLSQGAKRSGRIIDGAGHWAQFEQPTAINRALLEFLNADKEYRP